VVEFGEGYRVAIDDEVGFLCFFNVADNSILRTGMPDWNNMILYVSTTASGVIDRSSLSLLCIFSRVIIGNNSLACRMNFFHET
jgi:hypothetical protein